MGVDRIQFLQFRKGKFLKNNAGEFFISSDESSVIFCGGGRIGDYVLKKVDLKQDVVIKDFHSEVKKAQIYITYMNPVRRE